MKLSEMNTAQLAECLCKIAAPVERIGKSESVIAYFKSVSEDKREHVSNIERAASMFGALVPALLDTNRVDVFSILSAMTGKTVDEIGAQTGMQTLRELRECFDKELLDFFTSSGSMDAGK